MRKLYKKLKYSFIRIILRRPFQILILSIFLTAISIIGVLKLKLDPSLFSLLPDSYESVRNSKKVIEEIGGIDQFVILLKSQNFSNTLKYAENLKNELEKIKEVKKVYYSKYMEFFYDNALLYADLEKLQKVNNKIKKSISKEKLKKSSFYFEVDEDISKSDDFDKEIDEFSKSIELTNDKKYFMNPEDETLGIVVMQYGTSADVAHTQKMYKLLNEVINSSIPINEDKSIKIEIGGSYKNKIDEYDAIIANAKESALYVGLAILFLLIIYFKNFLSPFVIIIPLIFSISWTFGLTEIVIGGLNVFTLFLFLILLGFGVDIGIIIYARYVEFRKKFSSIAMVLYYTYKSIAEAVFTTVFTTVLAFFLLMFTRFKGFSEFGFITAVGVLFAMIAYFMMIPSFMIILEKLKFARFKFDFKIKSFDKLLNISLPVKYSKIIFYGFLIITALLIPVLFLIEFDYDFKNLRPQIKQFEDTRENISKVFKDSFSPAVLFADSIEEVDTIIQFFNEKIETKAITTVEKLRTIRDIVPRDQTEKIELIQKIKETLIKKVIPELKKKKDELSKTRLLKIEKLIPSLNIKKEIDLKEVPQLYIDKFFNISKTKYLIYLYPSVQLRNGLNAMKFADELTNLNINGKIYSAASPNIVLADVLRAVMSSGKLALLLAMLGTFIILLIDFRSFKRALFVDLPHLVGYIWLGAIMVLFGMKLNFYNIISFSILMGMGINPAIYIYHRFLEENDSNLKSALLSTMIAVLITTATTVFGFIGVASTSHGGLHSLGIMTAIGMIIFYFATLIFMLPYIHMKKSVKH